MSMIKATAKQNRGRRAVMANETPIDMSNTDGGGDTEPEVEVTTPARKGKKGTPAPAATAPKTPAATTPATPAPAAKPPATGGWKDASDLDARGIKILVYMRKNGYTGPTTTITKGELMKAGMGPVGYSEMHALKLIDWTRGDGTAGKETGQRLMFLTEAGKKLADKHKGK